MIVVSDMGLVKFDPRDSTTLTQTVALWAPGFIAHLNSWAARAMLMREPMYTNWERLFMKCSQESLRGSSIQQKCRPVWLT